MNFELLCTTLERELWMKTEEEIFGDDPATKLNWARNGGDFS